MEPGYAGGDTPTPTYKQVCSGTSGHAEVIRIHYDPKVIDYKTILGIFMATHDPTQLNKQGADVGTQYRSTIMPQTAEEKQIAEEVLKELEAKNVFDNKIVTTIEPLEKFHVAEEYHHNYYNDNPAQGYCSMVITPKVQKFKKQFESYLKSN